MKLGARIGLALPLVVALVSGVCFLPALSGSFLNWDDNVNFLDNPAYRGLGLEQVRWAASTVLFAHYIPLTRLTWSANYALGGLDPWGYHLVNLALHATNAAIFYFVALRLLTAAVGDGAPPRRRGPDLAVPAAVAALVFGVHPLRVEPVPGSAHGPTSCAPCSRCSRSGPTCGPSNMVGRPVPRTSPSPRWPSRRPCYRRESHSRSRRRSSCSTSIRSGVSPGWVGDPSCARDPAPPGDGRRRRRGRVSTALPSRRCRPMAPSPGSPR